MSTPKPIVVKNDEASTVYAWRGPTNEDGSPAPVIRGVPARDLDEFDLAAMPPDLRLGLQLEAKRDGGAYRKVGRMPAGLAVGDRLDDSDEVVPVPDADPAAKKAGKE